MDSEEQIIEIWSLFKGYIDKKQVSLVAERYVDFLVDSGVSDETLMSCLGHSHSLDNAIHYYLDMEDDVRDEDDFDEYEE